MEAFVFRFNALLGTLFLILANGGCGAPTPGRVNSETKLIRSEAVQPFPADAPATEADGKAPGMNVYIDPKSGKFTSEPSEDLPAQRRQQSLETVKQPATEPNETLSPIPGGGVTIHLGDRFLTPLTATVDADGKIRLEHLPTLPDSK